MEQEKIINVLDGLNFEIVNSYNKEKNQVLLQIHPKMFNQIIKELNN
jgi:hypothetical protein